MLVCLMPSLVVLLDTLPPAEDGMMALSNWKIESFCGSPPARLLPIEFSSKTAAAVCFFCSRILSICLSKSKADTQMLLTGLVWPIRLMAAVVEGERTGRRIVSKRRTEGAVTTRKRQPQPHAIFCLVSLSRRPGPIKQYDGTSRRQSEPNPTSLRSKSCVRTSS